jgi:ribosomal protein S18 acetylase RimI-like enzyme
MIHPLDRPVWSALNSRQAHLTVASGAAVRIDPAYGPFAAARDYGDEAQTALAATLKGPDDRIYVVEREPWPPPTGTQVVGTAGVVQMIPQRPLLEFPKDPRVVLLTEADAAEMAALAHATEPGPWSSATHRYGDYFGIRVERRLAAMAGERMLVPGLAELSGVSTWPEFRGHGLAAALIRRVLAGFAARGDEPFLHCFAQNDGAIRLYEQLGFGLRARLVLTILALA